MHKFLDSTEPRLVSTVLGRTIQAKAPMPPRVHEPSGPSAGDPGPALAWLRDSFNQTRSDFKIVSATRKIESDNRVSIFVILKSPGNDTDNERNDTIKSLEIDIKSLSLQYPQKPSLFVPLDEELSPEFLLHVDPSG